MNQTLSLPTVPNPLHASGLSDLLGLAPGALYEIGWRVDKYRDGTLYESRESSGNLLLNTGRELLYQLMTGTGGTPFNNTNSLVWVGNGTTPADATQTGLTGSSTFSKHMETGFPTVVNGELRFKARFGEPEANFAWKEFGVSNGTVMLNRKTQDIGTKTSDDEWVFTVAIKIQ